LGLAGGNLYDETLDVGAAIEIVDKPDGGGRRMLCVSIASGKRREVPGEEVDQSASL